MKMEEIVNEVSKMNDKELADLLSFIDEKEMVVVFCTKSEIENEVGPIDNEKWNEILSTIKEQSSIEIENINSEILNNINDCFFDINMTEEK